MGGAFVYAQGVAEGVEQVEAGAMVVPRAGADAGAEERVVLGVQFGVQFADPSGGDVDDGAGRPVPMVLGKMKHQRSMGDLAVPGASAVELVLPVQCEAEVVEVEIVCLLTIEDSQDRNSRAGGEAHPPILPARLQCGPVLGQDYSAGCVLPGTPSQAGVRLARRAQLADIRSSNGATKP